MGPAQLTRANQLPDIKRSPEKKTKQLLQQGHHDFIRSLEAGEKLLSTSFDAVGLHQIRNGAQLASGNLPALRRGAQGWENRVSMRLKDMNQNTEIQNTQSQILRRMDPEMHQPLRTNKRFMIAGRKINQDWRSDVSQEHQKICGDKLFTTISHEFYKWEELMMKSKKTLESKVHNSITNTKDNSAENTGSSTLGRPMLTTVPANPNEAQDIQQRSCSPRTKLDLENLEIK